MAAWNWALIAAHVGLPFVGALQRYAVSYGYQGLTREQSLENAKMVFLMLALISAFIGLARVV